jgi:hypothetical protein
MVLPAELEFSAAVTSIIGSPRAAMLFLSCFVTAEEHWLQSNDDDIMGPDAGFWQQLVSRFNSDDTGYSINTWLTAQAIATALCSQEYRALVKRERRASDDENKGNMFAALLMAIDECQRMSQHRRRQRRKHWRSPEKDERHVRNKSGSERGDEVAIEITLTSAEVVSVPERNVRLKKPTTVEEYNKLMSELANSCRASNQAGNETDIGRETERGGAGCALEEQHKIAPRQEGPNPELEPANALLQPLLPPPGQKTDATSSTAVAPRAENQKPSQSKKRRRNTHHNESKRYGNNNSSWNPPSAPRDMRQRWEGERGRKESIRGRGERGRGNPNTSFPLPSSPYTNTTHRYPPPTDPRSSGRYSDQYQNGQAEEPSYPYHKKSRPCDDPHQYPYQHSQPQDSHSHPHQHQKRQSGDMDIYEQEKRLRDLERRMDDISRSRDVCDRGHRVGFLDR